MATPESPFAHFASVDWAKQKHHAVILNPAGQIVAAFDFDHTGAGWQKWREQAARYAPLAVAIETSQGTVIDQLLQTPDCTIYPLNPKAARALSRAQSPRAAPRAII
jgi:Transposase